MPYPLKSDLHRRIGTWHPSIQFFHVIKEKSRDKETKKSSFWNKKKKTNEISFFAPHSCQIVNNDIKKAAGDVYAPIPGTVKSVNTKVAENPKLVNDSPLGDGWLVEFERVSTQDLTGLLNKQEYDQHCAEEDAKH